VLIGRRHPFTREEELREMVKVEYLVDLVPSAERV
jgi:hypothetical protein